MVRRQARVMAYLDVFWVFWITSLAAIPPVLLMKKSAAKGGAAMHRAAGWCPRPRNEPG